MVEYVDLNLVVSPQIKADFLNFVGYAGCSTPSTNISIDSRISSLRHTASLPESRSNSHCTDDLISLRCNFRKQILVNHFSKSTQLQFFRCAKYSNCPSLFLVLVAFKCVMPVCIIWNLRKLLCYKSLNQLLFAPQLKFRVEHAVDDFADPFLLGLLCLLQFAQQPDNSLK